MVVARTPPDSRPPVRAIVTVFGLGVVGTLVPVLGWLLGVWLVARADSWSRAEKTVAVVAPIVVLLTAVALLGPALGVGRGVPVLIALPLTLSLSSAAGAVYLAQRLVVHKRRRDGMTAAS